MVALICMAQVCMMSGYSAVPALLPTLIDEWSLNNAQGGWLAGVFFAGYVLNVLLVVALSDRLSARTIYHVSAVICVIAGLLVARTFVMYA